MIAFPVLMIAAGAVLRWALGDSASNGFTDALGLVLIALGTLWLAALVVTGRWWSRRERSLPDSTKV
jgi:hypothetical protein